VANRLLHNLRGWARRNGTRAVEPKQLAVFALRFHDSIAEKRQPAARLEPESRYITMHLEPFPGLSDE
jgi:hypothetical protein